MPPLRMRISRIVCDGGGNLDVKVRVFQIQRQPVPWAYLREDLFQSDRPELPFHQG